jgi:ABC-2 type transport system ATP-binding protein
MLLNLQKPDSGTATVLGRASTDLGAADFQRIGYVADGQDLPDWMTVAQLAAFCRPLYPTWDADLAARLMKSFDLPADRPIKKLSRGMRMKAALLSSLAFRPELMVMDEPFGGLDPLVRDDFIQGLLELPGDDRPHTFVVSSHDIDEVERLADDVGFLSGGRLLIHESADALRARFRRVEIVGTALEGMGQDGWLEVQRPAGNVLRFVHSAFEGPESEGQLAARFPGASVACRSMSLREIFLVLARQQRSPATQEAA